MKRKAQGAIEYLFMIAAALIIVAVVIRYLSKAKNEATSAVDENSPDLSQLTSSTSTTSTTSP